MSGNRYDDLIDGGGGRERPRRATRAASAPPRPRETREERREEPPEPPAAPEGGVEVRADVGIVEVGEGPGALTTPQGESYGDWLDRGLKGERRPKDYSAPAISDHHADLLDEDRRLLKELGYSRRQLSVGNMIELAVELHHEYVRRLVAEEGGGAPGERT